MFKIESIHVTTAVVAPRWSSAIKISSGEDIPWCEEFFTSLIDDEDQILGTRRKSCKAAIALLGQARAYHAELDHFESSFDDFWVFDFKFVSNKDAVEFLQSVEKHVNDSVDYI